MQWLLLVLVTAVTQAIKDAFLKRAFARFDSSLGMLTYTFAAAAFLWVGALAVPMPQITWSAFGPLLLMGGVLGGLTYYLYGRALATGDLSLTLPMLALTPLFLLVTSPVTLDEYPGPAGVAGVVLVATGAYVLNLRDRRYGFWGPIRALLTTPGTRYMLMVAAIWSLGANFDKLGIRSSAPALWGAAIYTATGLALLVGVLDRLRRHRRGTAWPWRALAVAGLLEALGLSCQMYALPMTQVAYVIAVKRLSIVFGVLIGAFVLREADLAHRLPGALLMVAGVSFIAIFG